MADFDPQQLDDLINAVRANTGAVGAMTNSLSGRDRGRNSARIRLSDDLEKARKSTQEFKEEMDRAGEDVADTFDMLAGNTETASDRMRQFAAAIPAGTLLGAIAAWGKNALDSWRDMAGIGQTFNGSMIQLAAAAAEAGLPMDQFAASLKSAAKSVAIFGQRDVSRLMSGVRKASEAHGLYGYTIESLNELTGKYLDAQRLYGNRFAATSVNAQRSVQEFAKQVTAVAGATGTAREQIIEQTMRAMTDVAFTSRLIGRSSIDIEAFSERARVATTILAGLPGEAGETFSLFLTETLGWGTTLFTTAANDFVEAGMGSMLGSMDRLAGGINASSGDIEGATWGMIEEFKSQTEANMEGLRIQAMSGNASARRILQMYAEVQNLTQAQYEERKRQNEETQALTAFFASLGNIFKRLGSSLLTGFLGKLGDIESQMDNFANLPMWRFLEERFRVWGEKLGEFFANIDADEVNAWADTLEVFMQGIFGLIGAVATLSTWIVQFANTLKNILEAPGKAVDGFLGLFGIDLPKGIKGLLGVLATVGAILGTWAALRMGGGMLANMFGQGMRAARINVQGAQVIVQGLGGMGGLDMLGGGGRRRPTRPGAAGRYARRYGAGAAARRFGMAGAAAAGVAGAAGAAGASGLATRAGARGAAGIAGRAVGKGILKKIPGISILAGLGFGAQRALSGDWLGAGGEVLSGLAGTIPGLGTAASVAIDGALMARDMGALGAAGRPGMGPAATPGGAATARPRGRGLGRWGMLGMGALGVGALGLGGAAALNWFNNRDPGRDAEGRARDAQGSVERSSERDRSAEETARQQAMDQHMRRVREQNDQLIQLHRQMLEVMNRQLQVSRSILAETQ